jgi:hypothetical protein
MLHSRSKKINQYSPTVHHVIVLISLDRVSMLLIVYYFYFSDDLYGKFTFSSSVYEVLESKGVLEIDVLFHRKLPV